eukprot:712717_1
MVFLIMIYISYYISQFFVTYGMSSLRFLNNPDMLDIIGICISAVTLLFCVPMMVIHLMMLMNQCKIDETVEKLTSHRELSIIIGLNILCLIELCLDLPLMLMSTVWQAMILPSWVLMFVYSASWDAICILYAVKTWKLHFKQQIALQTTAKLWQKHINPNVKHWYIQNQSKYANNRHLLRVLFPIYLFFITTPTVLEALFVKDTPDEHALVVHSFNALWNSLPLIFALVIFCKSKDMNDQYGIRNEFNIQTVFLWIFFAVYTVEFVVFNSALVIDIWTMEMHQVLRLRRIEYVLYAVNIVLINCVLALSSTLCPLCLANKKRLGHGSIEYNYTKVTNISLDTGSTGSSTAFSLSLTDLIADPLGFDLFIQHIVTEFATETVLFIIEVVQCKFIYSHISFGHDANTVLTNHSVPRAVFHDTNYDMFDMDGMTDGSLTITLPPALTYSEILLNPNGQFRNLTVYQAMHNLYRKYVLETSPFCINISGEMRRRLQSVFNQDTAHHHPSSILNVFDESAIDIVWTLQDVWRRFQSTNEFQLYINKHKAKRLNDNALL